MLMTPVTSAMWTLRLHGGHSSDATRNATYRTLASWNAQTLRASRLDASTVLICGLLLMKVLAMLAVKNDNTAKAKRIRLLTKLSACHLSQKLRIQLRLISDSLCIRLISSLDE